MIRILIAEDSIVVTRLLKAIFEDEPDMETVACAADGREAVRLVDELKPDLVTMDIRMPVMNGFEATRMIMTTNPTPIVVISASVNSEELSTTFRAIEEGALAVVESPNGLNNLDSKKKRREIVDTVRAMASVKVIRRRASRPVPSKLDLFASTIVPATQAYRLVAIGCSTGGPPALQTILSSLPIGFPAPIVIAQHISSGFVGGMVEWLQGHTLLKVKLAGDREKLESGTVYFAPDDHHLRVVSKKGNYYASLGQDALVNQFRPSATPLLESVAESCPGRAVGGLLTGMGKDGAKGLLAMRRAKCTTFVQDKKSAVVYGMADSALALDAVDQTVDLDKTAEYLTNLVRM
ncbi:MAG: chemotaxis protein CheB [Proteobacteria bacterium]|nr:chemotaxis protein CheB [Pseudomonadota bacterium]